MKIQDIVFIAALFLLILKRNPRLAAVAGIISLVLSIPLFSFWVFFTAERLTWYATAFFLLAIIFYSVQYRKKQRL
jgi:hypothetical protein